MKLKKEQEQFIIDAYNSNDVCSEWKSKIKEAFPKLFPSQELNKWYKDKKNTNWLMYKSKDNYYGFDIFGEWCYKAKFLDSDTTHERLATEEEVFEALKKEAERRGFKEGIACVDVMDNKTEVLRAIKFKLLNHTKTLYTNNCRIFHNGKWAEIITTITKEEAEKELGRKIID